MNINFFQTRTWRRLASTVSIGMLVSIVSVLTGCTSLTQNIEGIPAHRLPPEFFPPPKNNLVPVDIGLLALEPPREYQIDADDILGVYIEGVLPFNPPNAPPEPPPVNFPQEDSTLPPSIGYPIAVQDDGTISLPLIEPLNVRGLTLDQVRDKMREAYINEDILRPEKARPIVTLIQERTYDVIVVRQDGLLGQQGINPAMAGGGFIRGIDNQATGGLVKLKAYENDILHALVETGGLPGLNAKNEVTVLRASNADKRKRAEFIRQFYAAQAARAQDPCYCPPEIPDDPNALRIPLRVPPGVVPNLTEEDIMLNEGDIVFVENRETEVFYTGGLLPGGEFPLPRDYDLDVLGAMALAGGGAIQGQNGQSFGLAGISSLSGVPPGRLFVLRRTPCNGQVAIEVDLSRAINDPRSRPLVQPGDTLILQYTCEEEAINFGVSTFFTFGIRELLSGN